MSYDKSIDRNRRSAREWLQVELEDKERMDFLWALDNARFEVTEWEAQFVGGFLDAPRPMTARQRECVDELRKKYGGRL